jgi:hypothetical protein
MEGDQGFVMPVVAAYENSGFDMIAYHLDCFMKSILPHGPDCPHCRGVEPRMHAPLCSSKTTGLCDCIPMPDGSLPEGP